MEGVLAKGERLRNCNGLISGKELLKLSGIEDRNLFCRNVRFYRDQTNVNRLFELKWAGACPAKFEEPVNKGLRNSIQTCSEHAYFPAYHNGLTLLTTRLRVHQDRAT